MKDVAGFSNRERIWFKVGAIWMRVAAQRNHAPQRSWGEGFSAGRCALWCADWLCVLTGYALGTGPSGTLPPPIYIAGSWLVRRRAPTTPQCDIHQQCAFVEKANSRPKSGENFGPTEGADYGCSTLVWSCNASGTSQSRIIGVPVIEKRRPQPQRHDQRCIRATRYMFRF